MEPAPIRPHLVGRSRWWLVSLVGLLTVGPEPTSGQQPGSGPPFVTLGDPRLGPLRVAAARWASRPGPDRAVVDQVCLVPDLAGFFEAVAHWDRAHYFPILIEDAESTLRFVRAFHPARVVRLAQLARPIPPGQTWTAALAAVGASWREPGSPLHPAPTSRPQPDCAIRPPATLGATPPGVVLSSPATPMLAAAVALAAGRFQPLVRFDSNRGYRHTLALDEFRQFDRDLTGAVAAAVPDHLGLGDDCDFLTLAGDYPYRYRDANGDDEAVDDAIARIATGARWAYAGRILGDPSASVYRAMCALFLQPEAATLFNGYREVNQPWSEYSTRRAAARLAGLMPTATHHAAELDGGVASWYRAFDPENRSGLVWANSHGSPTVFHLQDDEPASTADIPRTVPGVVVMIHSFSASDPTDGDTIAGRWLANGAFVYFGSINEPYLQAFRAPDLAVDLLAAGLPLAAVLRKTAIEPFGTPWRLEYLGDPLFRIRPRITGASPDPAHRPRRVPPDDPTGLWSPLATAPGAIPTDGSPEGVLRAGFDSAVVLVGSPRMTPNDPALSATIASLADLDRATLRPESRRLLDSILADLLFFSRRRAELRERIDSIPAGERSPELVRWLDAIRGARLAWVLASDDFDRITKEWSGIIRSSTAGDFRRQATARVGALATDPDRRTRWAAALRAAAGNRPLDPASNDLAAELKRVVAAIEEDERTGPPQR